MSDTDVEEPESTGPECFWTETDLHKVMQKYRDEARLNEEWRYHVVVERKIGEMGKMGVMYDIEGNGATGKYVDYDLNDVAREWVVLAAKFKCSGKERWITQTNE